MGFAVMTPDPGCGRAGQDHHQDVRTMPPAFAVGIKKGGCAGMEYAIDLASEINPKDDRIERDGATVFVAPEAVLYLLGTEMDYEVTTAALGLRLLRTPTRPRPVAAASRSS